MIPIIPFDAPVSLATARAIVASRIDDGVRCPCCGLFAKRYNKRVITSSMAIVLIFLSRYFREHPDERWIHVITHLHSLRLDARFGAAIVKSDWTKLAYWGFVEAEGTKRADGGKGNGFWGITQSGYDFVAGRITAPKYASVFDGICEGLSGSEIDIRGTLGTKFDYEQLMTT